MVRTDLYKLNLKSFKDGEQRFVYALDDRYFDNIGSDISGGEINAEVVCLKRGELFQLHIALSGYIVTTCDRCLDEVELDVETERRIVVKFGEEYREESDEMIIVSEREGVLDLQWLLYEDIALSLPLQRMHEEGECNSAMMQLYNSLATDQVEPETQDSVARDANGIDQRWAALQRLKKE